MSDAKTIVEKYIRAKNYGATAVQNKILKAAIALSDEAHLLSFVNGETDTLKGFETPADRTNFYFENKAILMEYAALLAKHLNRSQVVMLAAMSFDEGKRPIKDREAVAEAIFINDDRNQPYFPVLTSVLVNNVIGGIKSNMRINLAA